MRTRRAVKRIAVLWAALILAVTALAVDAPARAESPPAIPPPPGPCTDVKVAVATDIDATLTKADVEFWLHVLFPSLTDPQQMPYASDVMDEYRAKGYRVIYITARPNDLRLSNGETARADADAWLSANGFPDALDTNMLYLAPDILSALLPADYKKAAVEALMADGYDVRYGYGNSDTDFEGFMGAGIPAENVFSIGERAGWGGTTPIYGHTYEQHLDEFMPTVPAVCDPDFTPPGPPVECPLVPYKDLLSAWLSEIFGIPVAPSQMPCQM